MPPTIGAAMRRMTSAPVPVAQRIGQQGEEGRDDGHRLGPDPLHRSVVDRLREVGVGGHPALGFHRS